MAAPPVKVYSFVRDPVLNRSGERHLLSFKSFNRTFSAQLWRNDNLIVRGKTEIFIDDVLQGDGPVFDSIFSGELDDGSGWARFVMSPSIPNQFEGTIATTHGTYHVKAIDSYKRSKRDFDIDIASPLSRPHDEIFASMIVISENIPDAGISCVGHNCRRASANEGNPCGLDHSHPHNKKALKEIQSGIKSRLSSSLHRRDTTGCPGSIKYMFIAAAADCNYVSSYGGAEAALNQMLSDFNAASKVYETSFNVRLALIKVNIQTACGGNLPWNIACSDTYTINNRLSDFSQWRGTSTDQAGLWHLLTGCSSSASGSAVGVAWLKTTCLTTSSLQVDATGNREYVSGTGVSSRVPVEWKVVAHEIGHNFGAIHDCSAATCPNADNCCACPSTCDCKGQFIMHPTDNSVTDNFSQCSITNICATLGEVERSACLKNQEDLTAIQTNICGNGVREGNEQCDCGDADSCKNDSCCDGKTCKLVGTAVCDDNNDDCCFQCQLKSNGTMCRPSIGQCDIPEYCSGISKSCPPDLHYPDKQPCGTSSGLACASGACTSRKQQCSTNAPSIITTGVCSGYDASCGLFCATTNGDCLELAGNFIDGTPCGYAGVCQKGSCNEDGWLGKAVDWFTGNPQIGIPVVVAVGLIVLAIIFALFRLCFRKWCDRAVRPKPRPQHLPVIPSSSVAQTTPFITSGLPNRPASRADRSHWVDPTAYNG